MGNIGDIAFSQGDIMRELREVKRQLREIQAARRLENAAVGAGGMRIHSGGGITIHDAGSISVLDGGDIAITGGGDVTVSGGGDITISGGGGLAVTDGGDITVSGTSGIIKSSNFNGDLPSDAGTAGWALGNGSLALKGQFVGPIGFDQDSGTESGFAVTTTATNRAEATLAVPTWAEQAIVFSNHYAQAWNPTAGPAYLSVVGRTGGLDGPTAQFLAPAGSSAASGSIGNLQVITSPGSTINVYTRVNVTGTTWGTDASNYAVAHALAIFLAD